MIAPLITSEFILEQVWELHTIKNSYLIILDLIIEYIFIELKKLSKLDFVLVNRILNSHNQDKSNNHPS